MLCQQHRSKAVAQGDGLIFQGSFLTHVFGTPAPADGRTLQSTQLHAIYRLSDALHRAATLEEIFELAVDGVIGAPGAQRAAILLIDGGKIMRFRADRGLSTRYRQAVEGHNPWHPQDSDPLPILIEDVSQDASLAAVRAAIESEGIGAVAFIPITRNEALAGKFMLYYDAPHQFNAVELEGAVAVSNHVGFAIERKHAENLLRDEQRLFVDGPVVVFKWRAEHGWPVEFVSANVLALTGHARRDWLDGTLQFKALIHAADRDRVHAEIWHRHREAVEQFSQEYRIVRADGQTRWIRDFTRILRDESGVTRFFHAYLQDVTEAKLAEDALRDLTATLEARVTERTAALSEACRELEAFTYSMSHDLRAPLRAIDGYSALLREAAVAGDVSESLPMFDKIRAATGRVSVVVDEMLALARLSQQAVTRRRVDMSGMAEEIAAALHDTDRSRVVDWAVQPGMMADAEPDMVRTLLGCLMGNAWKFTSGCASARIEVGIEQVDGGARFFVADNGAGFDMQYAANLFNPFQRLHSADQFPGAGIGLATAARVVRRHDGRIHAIAAPDEGARFMFTLAPG